VAESPASRITLVGALYFAVGAASVILAWGVAWRSTLSLRWAAFAISGIIFAWHIAREWLRHQATVREIAWRAAAAVALGALGLALMANIHEVLTAPSFRPLMLTALVLWPLLTGLPAFLVALAAASILTRTERT
jgi:hypothetical protein